MPLARLARLRHARHIRGGGGKCASIHRLGDLSVVPDEMQPVGTPASFAPSLSMHDSSIILKMASNVAESMFAANIQRFRSIPASVVIGLLRFP